MDYDYSIGGGVHLGETAEECVCREVFDATGIHYEIQKLAVFCFSAARSVFSYGNFAFLDNGLCSAGVTGDRYSGK